MEQTQSLSKKPQKRSSLFWKIALTFLILVSLIGISYISITLYFSDKYLQESQQQLHSELAAHLVDEKFQNEAPFLPDGSINEALFGDIMHEMMAVNRSIEVYVLDETGLVKHCVVLDKNVLEANQVKVDMGPVTSFIAETKPHSFILGDDPRNPGEKKIFSAAPFEFNGQTGYIYIILAGEVYQSVMSGLRGSYFFRIGTFAFMATLLFALFIGLLIIWYLTRHLRKIITAVRAFEKGDLDTRIALSGQGEFSELADAFNHMADRILHQIEEIKQTETLRRELIANVSHDLRTPLAVAHGYVETLQLKAGQLSPEEIENYIQIILKNTEKLNKLVGELFELSKLEAQQVKAQKEPFFIQELLWDTQKKYQLLAEEKGLQLRINDLSDSVPRVIADISLIERVLQNLLDNAIKFTPQGGEVCIEAHAEPEAESVVVSISDTGIGIAPERVPDVFDRFTTQHRSEINPQGTGLGLAITRKILELHDSHIQVFSRQHEGTQFSFGLPMATS